MKTITATPIDIAILRRSENGESFAHIAEQSEIIQHLGEKYSTPSQRSEKLKRMAERADWHRFQLRRKGLELPEALPRLNETPQPAVHSLNNKPQAESPEIVESAEAEEPQTKFGKVAAELLKPVSLPKLQEPPRPIFMFDSGKFYERADDPQNPGGIVDGVFYDSWWKQDFDKDRRPVHVYYVVGIRQYGQVLRIIDDSHAEWRNP